MTADHSTPSAKPAKPYPEIPLTVHPSGQWCKKIRGKLHYFGKLDDPERSRRLQAALAKRKEPKDQADAVFFFITKFGTSWSKTASGLNHANPISWEMKKLLQKLGINGRRNFYALRHTFETRFDEVTQPLCSPPAAWFVFCLALMAAKAVAVRKAALRATHGEEKAAEMSADYLALESQPVHEGMMIALPPDAGTIFRDLSVAAFAAKLKEMAAPLDLGRYRKSKRGPKKPPSAIDQYRNGGYVSTYKILRDKKH